MAKVSRKLLTDTVWPALSTEGCSRSPHHGRVSGTCCKFFYGWIKEHQSQITSCENVQNHWVIVLTEHECRALHRAIWLVQNIYRTLIRKSVLSTFLSLLMTLSQQPWPWPKGQLGKPTSVSSVDGTWTVLSAVSIYSCVSGVCSALKSHQNDPSQTLHEEGSDPWNWGRNISRFFSFCPSLAPSLLPLLHL